MTHISRRRLIAGAASTGAVFGLGSTFWNRAIAEPATPGTGPYGDLREPDDNGLALPAGFTSRIVARTGEPVGRTGYLWPTAPDGAAVFATSSGGWIQTVNHETIATAGGGVSAIEYDGSGAIVDAYRILAGTNVNCAGGPSPWGTWLSCEEYDLTEATEPAVPGFPFGPGVAGQVWECDPAGSTTDGVALPALGKFSHEAVAIDPATNVVYLTEDQGDGHFYRFTPDTANVGGVADLTSGTLEAAVLASPEAVPAGSSAVSWIEIPDPGAVTAPTRRQVSASVFQRGEGAWFDSGVVYFVTTRDDRVWAYDTVRESIEVIYDLETGGGELEEPDNVTVHPMSGELFVAEDDGNLELVLITPPTPAGTRTSAPFMRISGQEGTEVAGPCFDPSGTRMYFSSQRGLGGNGGITYEVTGPFTTGAPDPEIPEVPIAVALPLSAAVIGAGALALRNRNSGLTTT